MKSGPVFLWRGSVALLCEACQRLMIRWNIQTPATRRQAHWYAVIPNRGLSYADPQTFMHAHILAVQTHAVHALHSHVQTHTHTRPLLSTLQRRWFMSQTWHQGHTQQSDWKTNEWRSDWFLQEDREKSCTRHQPFASMSRMSTAIHDFELFLNSRSIKRSCISRPSFSISTLISP